MDTRLLWQYELRLLARRCCINRRRGWDAARSPRPFFSAIFRQSLNIADIKELSVASARQLAPRPAMPRLRHLLGSIWVSDLIKDF